MKKEWKEDEISPGFLCEDAFIVIAIPLCSVCKNWDGFGKCKKLGKSPDAYSDVKKRDCPYAVLDTADLSFPRFAELYPEDTKKLLERQS